jgi:hypothetical protein
MESESRWDSYRERLTGKDCAAVCLVATNKRGGGDAAARLSLALPIVLAKTSVVGRRSAEPA